MYKNLIRVTALTFGTMLLSGAIFSGTANAQSAKRPSLIITSQPIPESLRTQLEQPAPEPAPYVAPVSTAPAPTAQNQTLSYVRTPQTTRSVIKQQPRTADYMADETVGTYPKVPAPFETAIYSDPVRVREVQTFEVVGKNYYEPMETLVTKKIRQINSDLITLKDRVVEKAKVLQALEAQNDTNSAAYHAAVATISTQLQSGTTPGNPRLVKRLATAETQLENLASSLDDLNKIAVDTSKTASEAQFLLEETRAAYTISGAVEEDHIELEKTEDTINNTLVMIERVLNTVNEDLSRTGAYVNTERNNMRTLSVAVANGELYGKNFANRAFSAAPQYQESMGDSFSTSQPLRLSDKEPDGEWIVGEELSDNSGVPPVPYNVGSASVSSESLLGTVEPSSAPYGSTMGTGALSEPRMLAKISFDRPDVQYEQPVYVAVNEALERYPNARFDLVAANPTQGNAAQVAIESTRARRNAEKVLRVLTQMGVNSGDIDIAYTEDSSIQNNEVRLFVK